MVVECDQEKHFFPTTDDYCYEVHPPLKAQPHGGFNLNNSQAIVQGTVGTAGASDTSDPRFEIPLWAEISSIVNYHFPATRA